MSIVNTVTRLLIQNPLTTFNTILIGITIFLSYQSFQFQTRTGVRESLEQLDDIAYGREKFSPILHSFSFRPIRGHRTTVHLKYYRFSNQPASASSNQNDVFHRTFYSLNNGDASSIPRMRLRNAITEKLSTLDVVDSVWIEDTGIFVEFETGNAVEVRRRTETVLQSLSQWHTTNRETFVETFDLESWEPIQDSEE